ncbi:MAG: extracellular solute-binding protein, partial [Rhizobiaceae bacterium]|nr:extracellular solute-binding protein [Rhizobiaceae bacterium]
MRWTRNMGATLAVSLAAWASWGGMADAANVTLTVSRWAGPQADAQKKLLDEYAAKAGVTIKLDAIDYGQLKQKQTLNMSTKTGEYDLIYVPEAWFGEYSKAGYLAKLDDWIKDPKLTGDGWDFADFTKAGLDVYTAGGSLQALPYFVQTPLLVYDKDALKKAGFEEPKTWDDLLKVSKYFKDQGSGIALPYRQGSAITNIMAILLAGDGTNFFDANGKLDLTQPAVVETVKFMQDVGKFSLNGSNGWHWDEVNKALQFGQAPMGIT